MKFDLENLPKDLLKDTAIRLEIEEGVLIFRATEKIQTGIAEQMEKEKNKSLSANEIEEQDAYEEIDDYLSYVNRIIRNSAMNSEVNITA